MARNKNGMPTIVDVAEMPPRTYGRAAANLAPLVPALRDGAPHAIEEVRTEEDRRQWRRRLRRAAQREGVKVETRYSAGEARLYFQSKGREAVEPRKGRPAPG
jgi:hypothetical protein